MEFSKGSARGYLEIKVVITEVENMLSFRPLRPYIYADCGELPQLLAPWADLQV